ncbi:hypothetical protein [Halomarina oriensis]|uniref:DUF4239 domain-containing protein n=1 Tax=Halomarina oriensis TaxID=671145 RepID=A0A6B0GJT0_9EURY|nr:hypothetical protein [Halomarina oriensis]MWG35074.1 hypothetical protein [Halomarina oriensis]
MSEATESDSAEAGDQPEDKMRQRSNRSTIVLRLLLETDRRLFAAGLFAVILVAILLVGIAHPTSATILRTGDPVETLFNALISATITGVTVVLTLNQLVLSQELGAVGDQRERMEGAMEFREDVETLLDTPVAPADPSAFLRALIEVTAERAEDIRETLDTDNEDLHDYVDELVSSTTGNATQVSQSLEGEQFGRYSVLSAALNFNYSWKLYAARRIRNQFADELSEEADEALAEFVETLRLFGPGREHFKTLYFQWELINLSRAIVATAIPALVVAIATLVYYDPGVYGGILFGVDQLVVFVAVAASIAVAPFVVLLSYVLRIATVTKRTLSIGPFILRDTDRDEDLDWR